MTVTAPNHLLAENGNFLTTEAGDHIALQPTAWSASLDGGSLSFVGSISFFVHLFTTTLTATLSFSGSFVKKAILVFTVISHLLAENGNRLLTEAGDLLVLDPVRSGGFLSFNGFLPLLRPKLFSGTLSFAGNLIKSCNRFYTATLSFIGLFTPFKLSPQILLTATLSFTTYFLRRTPQIFQILLTSFLRLNGTISYGWKTISNFIMVSVHSFQSQLQQAIGRINFLSPRLRTVATENQIIGTTPTALTLGGLSGPFAELFIKNLDKNNTVQVDTSSSFNHFPQSIPPLRGVVLSPNTASTIYARSNIGPATIQIIVGH